MKLGRPGSGRLPTRRQRERRRREFAVLVQRAEERKREEEEERIEKLAEEHDPLEDWERQFDYAGIPYYVNLLTNEVQWEEPSQEQLRETLRQRQQYLDAGVALGNLREQDEGQPQLSSAGPSAAGTERRTASRDGPRKGQEVGGGDKRVASAKATRREEGKGEDEEEPWPEMQVYPKPDFESLLHMDEAIRKGVEESRAAVERTRELQEEAKRAYAVRREQLVRQRMEERQQEMREHARRKAMLSQRHERAERWRRKQELIAARKEEAMRRQQLSRERRAEEDHERARKAVRERRAQARAAAAQREAWEREAMAREERVSREVEEAWRSGEVVVDAGMQRRRPRSKRRVRGGEGSAAHGESKGQDTQRPQHHQHQPHQQQGEAQGMDEHDQRDAGGDSDSSSESDSSDEGGGITEQEQMALRAAAAIARGDERDAARGPGGAQGREGEGPADLEQDGRSRPASGGSAGQEGAEAALGPALPRRPASRHEQAALLRLPTDPAGSLNPGAADTRWMEDAAALLFDDEVEARLSVLRWRALVQDESWRTRHHLALRNAMEAARKAAEGDEEALMAAGRVMQFISASQASPSVPGASEGGVSPAGQKALLAKLSAAQRRRSRERLRARSREEAYVKGLHRQARREAAQYVAKRKEEMEQRHLSPIALSPARRRR